MTILCDKCEGTGRDPKHPSFRHVTMITAANMCQACCGTGRQPRPRRVRVRIEEIVLECPWCDEYIQNTEGNAHNECVAAEAGVAPCPNCGKPVVIPDMGPLLSGAYKPRLPWPEK